MPRISSNRSTLEVMFEDVEVLKIEEGQKGPAVFHAYLEGRAVACPQHH